MQVVTTIVFIILVTAVIGSVVGWYFGGGF